jgi:hypothetical protein
VCQHRLAVHVADAAIKVVQRLERFTEEADRGNPYPLDREEWEKIKQDNIMQLNAKHFLHLLKV